MMTHSRTATTFPARRLQASVVVGAIAVLVLAYHPATTAVTATSPMVIAPSPAPPPSSTPTGGVMGAGLPFADGAGVAGCAAASCHGGPLDGTRRDWRSAFSVWSAEDPHRRAFEVLYSTRSVEIYRNLNTAVSADDSAPASDPYAQFLTQRCVGCHATEAPTDSSKSSADSLESLLDGVTCASCHARPAGWREGHYLSHWPPASDPTLEALMKSLAPTNLRMRAALCAACHVGPQRTGDHAYDVTHDLIAAGHPRLAFEFSTYLANYPKHWDDDADRSRYERTTGGRFNVDAWRIGQEVAAQQIVDQLQLRLDATVGDGAVNGWPDFSHFECADCHHDLAPPNAARPRAARAVGRAGTPRAAFEPLDNLARLRHAYAGANDSLSEQARRVRNRLERFEPSTPELVSSVAVLRLNLSRGPVLEPCRNDALIAHGRLLSRLVRTTTNESVTAARAAMADVTWESAVRWLLAVDALAHDLPPRPDIEQLREDIRQLRAALSDPNQFADDKDRAGTTRLVTIYDTPTSFDPTRVQGLLSRIADQLELESLYTSPAELP